jgi:hypothetical protein
LTHVLVVVVVVGRCVVLLGVGSCLFVTFLTFMFFIMSLLPLSPLPSLLLPILPSFSSSSRSDKAVELMRNLQKTFPDLIAGVEATVKAVRSLTSSDQMKRRGMFVVYALL